MSTPAPTPTSPASAPGPQREIRTERLRLRPFHARDQPALAALNADPRVMEFLSGVLTREQSDALAARILAHAATHGFGPWTIEVMGEVPGEVPGRADFVGLVALMIPAFQAAFTPCVEIAWRLSASHWGHGYATEAAQAALRHGFMDLGLPEIVAFTVPANVRSRRVMERLGMQRDAAADFLHPNLPEGDPLRPHVLYRLTRKAWDAR